MKYSELLDIVGGQPVFSSGLLRAGDIDTTDLASQLSRWVASGRLLQLRRGVYALPEAYRSRAVHPFRVANVLVRPSYVSLESALAYHGVIPEAVFTTTSITTARAGEFATPLGSYSYRHVGAGLFWGYSAEIMDDGEVWVARPEKALLDLTYLRPGGDSVAFLQGLRLDPARLDQRVLCEMAARTGKPKLMRVAARLADAMTAHGEWEDL